MTKAKAVKTPAAAEKQPAAAAKKPAKPAAKAAKPAAAPAEAEKPVKPAAAEKSVKPVAKPPSKPSAKAKGKTASHETERIVKPEKPQPLDEPTPRAEARQPDSVAPQTTDSGRFRFGGSGLGIKTAPKKPGLTAAPGVMLLNRPAPAKPEASARPSERRLGKKEQQEIRSFLLEKRERLIAGMRRELAMQKERADSKAADEVDKATDAYDEDLSFEIATANDQELGEIQVALEKIEKGTYGECEICGCAISLSRLKVLPSATTCVSCRGQEELARRRDEPGPSFLMAEDAETEAGPL